MRRGFTLIEILTIVAIIAIMVTVAVMGVGTGERAARIRGATRDIFATIRQARSIALVTQQSTVLTYSTVTVDDEVCARVTLDSVKLMSSQTGLTAQTLSGEVVRLDGLTEDPLPETEDTEASDTTGGETLEEILFAPIEEDVLRGIAIKVIKGEELAASEELKHVSSSAFSNADVLLGRYSKPSTNQVDSVDQAVTPSNEQEPVSIAWEPNGRCEAHEVWVYPAGADYEQGLCIKIDRFGAAKVLSGDDYE